jgi:anthranilate synthase component I
MTPERFDELIRQGYNRIPLVREVLADLDTPLSVYLKLAAAPYSYLFESVQGGEKWGRYSFIGLPARTVVKVRGRHVTVEDDGTVVEDVQVDDPLAWMEGFQARQRVPEIEGLPRFTGGLVGYFGYDTIRYIEPRLAGVEKPDPLGYRTSCSWCRTRWWSTTTWPDGCTWWSMPGPRQALPRPSSGWTNCADDW